ncbi:MAG TPA: hypothetical protein PKY12_09785 [Catalimonadaceae bacterium]|nr:hypothetical protein [Catalimonadaceae bacterium]
MEGKKKTGGRRKKSGFSRSEMWIAGMATVISLCALLTSLYQTVLDRRHQVASVWPYVMITRSNIDPAQTGNPYFEIQVMNKGVGPAILNYISYSYKGKKFNNAYDLLNEILVKPDFYIVSDIWKGRVVSTNETISHMVIKGPQAMILDSVSKNISIKIQYTSVFEEKWESRFNTGDPNLVVRIED